jgi:flagellar hook protein FlgE
MALTSTLFTGLSGLNTNQTRMNVVGNNIANVNTVAFKASRALFKPQAYVTDQAGGPPSGESGGTNPSQRGLGATVASIDKDFSGGSISATGKNTDMAIEGEGFFVVQTREGQQYTRDGSFSLNANHDLVTSGGAYVQGYGVDDNSNIVASQLRNINVPLGAQIAAKATSTLRMEGNLDASGALATNASGFMTQPIQTSGGGTIDPTTLLTDIESISAPGIPLFSTAPGSNTLTLSAKKGTGADSLPEATYVVDGASTVQDLMDFFNGALGIDATVAGPPTPGASIDATGTQLVITGNVGTANTLSLQSNALVDGSGGLPLRFTADPAMTAVGASVHTSAIAYDTLGQQVTLNINTVLESRSATGGTTWRFFVTSPDNAGGNLVLGNGTLEFDGTGQLIDTTGATISLDRTGTGAEPVLPLTLNFEGMSSLKQSTGMRLSRQDGYAAGELVDFAISTDGTITGSYSNGLDKTLGQVVLAKFNNPVGLIDEGGNMYRSGSNSGLPIIGAASTLGMGEIRGQSLELSNVDLSNEFINLIVASTGFTAASRVITTSNQLLTELLNTSR